MNLPLGLNSKRERRFRNSLVAGHGGRIKWTASGVEDCMRHLQKEWMALASRGKSKEWEPYSETVIYIRNKYGQLKGTPHYYRMAAVILFLDRHMKGLKKMGIVKPDGENFALWDDALFEAFAKLPFKPLTGFKFSDVRGYVLRSKKPN
jgi:hypothetical protein